MLTTIITHIALIALAAFIFVNVVNFTSSKLYKRKCKKIEEFYNSLTDKEKELFDSLSEDIDLSRFKKE